MITISQDGFVYIHRCDYPFRLASSGADRGHDMGDGDIVAHINPYAFKDIADAREIAEWINGQLPIPAVEGADQDAPLVVAIDYTNWRGERSIRRIIPGRTWLGTTEHHPDQQWLLDAIDVDKGGVRTFAMRDIHEFDVREIGTTLGHVQAPKKPGRPVTTQEEAGEQGRRVPKLSAILPALGDMTADLGPLGTAAYLVATWIKANPNLSALHLPRVHRFAETRKANVSPLDINLAVLNLVNRGLLVEWRGVISPEGGFVPGYWRKGQRIPKALHDLSDRRIRRDDGEVAIVYRPAEPPEADPTD